MTSMNLSAKTSPRRDGREVRKHIYIHNIHQLGLLQQKLGRFSLKLEILPKNRVGAVGKKKKYS